MGSHVALSRRLAPPALLALALLSGCSSERLSERMTYPVAAVTTATTVAAVPTVTASSVAPARHVLKRHKAAPKPPVAQPAASTPAPAPASPAPTHSRHVPSPSQQAAGPPPPPVSESDRVHETRGDAQARTTVIRFHRLLNDHNGDACTLLTPAFLQASYQTDPATALSECRAAVAAMTIPVTVIVEDSGIDAHGRWVQVLSQLGDEQRRQTMRLVKVGHAWLIDSTVPDPG
ncbi:MAG: hypothetical protein QOF12_453 [Solirubrobacteraceae bacterium]|nr:hypothetical protein [Solirubrobacteraceae bacterium]